MKFGFAAMNTPGDIAPAVLGRALEDRGYESLWYGEHSHIPVSRLTPHPSGAELPEIYKWMMNPFLSLLAAANATTELRIGTGVALPLEHDVLELAKTIATLDILSDGRFSFGVGVGWNKEELANHRPIPWAARYRALAECIAALRALWTEHESEFHGEFYDFDPVWSLPKPVQKPHPPVWLGSVGKIGMAQAAAWADGWFPVDKAMRDIGVGISRWRDAVSAAGRDPDGLPVTMVTFGDPEFELLERMRDLGVERVVIGNDRANWDVPETTMPFVDRYAEMIPKLA